MTGGLTHCQKHHTCYQCGRPNATPHEGDYVPYCARCKREHARRQKGKEEVT